MADPYKPFQKEAGDLLDEWQQGVIRLVIPGETTGPEWAPVIGPPTYEKLSATVKGVPLQMVDGTRVTTSDLLVTMKVPKNIPTENHSVEIDGEVHEIVKVMPVPPAGTPVVYKVVVRE